MGVLILTFAFSQGVFPKPPDFADLNAFDLSYLASHPRFTLFLLTFLAVAALVGFAVLSVRLKAFWARVRQGFTILFDRERYFREVFAVQFAGWLFRFAAFWFLLEAFNVGGSVKNVLLVLGVNAVAAAVPFTPQGAGVQQALLAKVFAGTASGATIASYSVAQQIAIGALTFGIGFLSLIFIFRVRSFKEVIARGREERAAEAGRRAAPAADAGGSRRRRPSRRSLLGAEALAGLAHQRHGLGEEQADRVADLGRLLLGVALEVEPVDAGHRELHGQPDRVVRPGHLLGALHLLGHLGQSPAQLVRVAEQPAEGIFGCHACKRSEGPMPRG